MKTHSFTEGCIATAVRASCAMPGLIQPVTHNKKLYMDGGISDSIAINALPYQEKTFIHSLIKYDWEFKMEVAKIKALPNNVRALIIRDLPILNPFDLSKRKEAYQIAFEKTQKALNLRTNDKIIVV